jgi:hypothetical protein
MNRIVIFCENYGEIKRTLYLVTHNCRDCPISIVIPGNHDLFKFFQVINERVFNNTINLIYLERYLPRRAEAKGINKIFHVLPDIIRERRYLGGIFDQYFAQLQGCEVFFSSRGFNCYSFYLIKKLCKRNRLVYISTIPPQVPPMQKYIPTNFTDLASLIILKLTYGWDITLGKFPHLKGFAYVPDKFIKEKVGRVIDWKEMNEMMKNFDFSQFRIFDTDNYSIIYFDDGLIEGGYVRDREVFRRELSEIFNILAKYFPEKEIARKYHPGYGSDKTLIKIGDVLSDFIPAELLYNDNVKMYLSAFSFSLANVEKGLAVSLADLITLKDEETKNQLRQILITMSKSKILFPKSLDEFERIVSEVAKG